MKILLPPAIKVVFYELKDIFISYFSFKIYSFYSYKTAVLNDKIYYLRT